MGLIPSAFRDAYYILFAWLILRISHALCISRKHLRPRAVPAHSASRWFTFFPLSSFASWTFCPVLPTTFSGHYPSAGRTPALENTEPPGPSSPRAQGSARVTARRPGDRFACGNRLPPPSLAAKGGGDGLVAPGAGFAGRLARCAGGRAGGGRPFSPSAFAVPAAAAFFPLPPAASPAPPGSLALGLSAPPSGPAMRAVGAGASVAARRGRAGLLLPPPLLLRLLILGLAASAWEPARAAQEGRAPAPPEVVTGNGGLRGRRIQVGGAERSVDVFLGVPYAKPPVGALRFAQPQPAEPWGRLRDATSYPPMCLQDPVVGQTLSDDFTNKKEKVSLSISEDCLYLNIFAPVHEDKKAKQPVMVWIHGGGLLLGAASTYDGSVLAAYEDVVVVAIQYRLGILGFYSTGDEHARGNYGFLDQVAALKWIQENIEHFGGDPGSVTLFGESAGAFSTSAHVLSPLSKGLFHKAISESGVAAMGILIDAHPERLAKKVARAAGCQTFGSAEMVQCLKGKTEEEILQTTLKMDFTRLYINRDEKQTLFFPAVVDGAFLPKSPRDLLTEKGFDSVPYIVGFNNHEMGWIIPTVLQFPELSRGFDRETATRILHHAEPLTNIGPEHNHIIINEYLKDIRDPIQLRDQLLEIFGDGVIVAPSLLTAKLHRDAGYPAYVYEFQHRPSWHAGLKPDFVKADHGDEIGFVFGKPILAGDGTGEEKNLSKTVMKYWANFARSGDPNGAGLVNWPSYDQKEQYLEIGLKQKVAVKPKEKQVRFWTKTLPEKVAESKEGHIEL